MFKLAHIKESNGMWNMKASFQYCGHGDIRDMDLWYNTKADAVNGLKYLVYCYFVMQASIVRAKCSDAQHFKGHEFGTTAKRNEGLQRTKAYLDYMAEHDGEAEKALGYWLADKHHWKSIVPPKIHPWYSLIVEHTGDMFFTATHMLNEWKKPIEHQFTLKIQEAA